MASSTVTYDPTTGAGMHVKQHGFPVTMVNDAFFFGLCVMVADQTGFNRIYIPLPSSMAQHTYFVQAMRYGLLFATFVEFKYWLDNWGINTNLSDYWDSAMSMVRGITM